MLNFSVLGVKREMLRDKVTGILSAMQHGLLDARKMFPSLLPLLEVNDWLGEEFMIKVFWMCFQVGPKVLKYLKYGSF